MSERIFVFIVSFMWGSSSHKTTTTTAIWKGAGFSGGLRGADHG